VTVAKPDTGLQPRSCATARAPAGACNDRPNGRERSIVTKRRTIAAAGLAFLLATGCGCTKGGRDDDSRLMEPPEPAPGQAERPPLTGAECQQRSGTVVGDTGDGATRRPDYVCADGQPPLGSIRAAEGEPAAVDGSVCCPAAAG
jgi:hypothetical protein